MDDNRSKTIVKSGYLFILMNFLLAVFNIIVGFISNSLAIASDAIHSLIDSVSGLLIIVSEKLANHKKLSNQRAKIERITTILIALIIIAVAIELIVVSIKNLISPVEVEYSIPTMIVLVASIATKYLLARYLKQTGKRVYHVAKRPDGKWAVKFAGGEKAIKLFKTQAEAVEYTKKMSHSQKGVMLVHNSKGKNKGRIQ